MKFYKVKILKEGANHVIEKNICAENIDVAKEGVISYLGKFCAGDQLYSTVDLNYNFRSTQDDELRFKVVYSVANKGTFEFAIELHIDHKLEKFPEEIDIFNFINFPVPVINKQAS